MKKNICLILTFLLLASSFVIPQTQAQDAEYGNTAKILYSLGIVGEDYSERLSETANRCELARIAVEMMGFDAQEMSALGDGSTPFTDVHPNSMAGIYVSAANKLGLMNGYGAEFGVDDPVRYDDALRVLFRTIGCGGYAENVVGLYRAALETGISDGITVTNGEAIDIATLLELVFNTVQADTMYSVTNGDGVDYVKENGRTLLGSVHDITMISGIVTANEYTELYGEAPLDAGFVKIDDLLCLAGATDASEYIGSYADVYVYDIDGVRPEIKYIEENEDGTTVHFDADDYAGTDGNTLSYYVGDKSESKKISETADIIYNNKLLCKFYDMEADVLDSIVYGDITLKGNDGDNFCDVIIINDIKTDMITAYDSYASLLICKDGVYDLSDSVRDSVIVTKDGNPAAVSALSPGSAAEIRESADKKVIAINIISKGIIGTPTEINSDGTVTINSAVYEFIGKYTNDDFRFDRLIKVYVNDGGKIVYLTADSVTDEYIYGLVAGIKYAQGLDGTCSLKIFDQTGSMNVYEVADKFKLDGLTVEEHNLIGDAIGSLESAQLVKFKLNAESKISVLDTAVMGSNEDELSLTENCRNSNLIYKNTKTLGNGNYYIGSGTILFSAPNDVNDEERYFLYAASSLANDATYTVSAYDCDEYYIPAVIVITNSGGSIEGDSSVVVVEKTASKLNADGTEVNVIYGGNGGTTGQTRYWYTDGGECVPQVSPGDVIQVSAYSTGELSGYKVLVDAKTPFGCTTSSAKYNYSYGTIVGYDNASGVCVINTVEGAAERERISLIGFVNGYKVTEARGETVVVTASASDLVPGKRIYVRERYLASFEYVVFD